LYITGDVDKFVKKSSVHKNLSIVNVTVTSAGVGKLYLRKKGVHYGPKKFENHALIGYCKPAGLR